MARVLLILPELRLKMQTPYLGQMYIAASLVDAGHEVRCVDAGACRYSGSSDGLVRLAADYQPDMIGFSLFTANAWSGYQLAARLKQHARLLVAGGPHVTVCPREPLGHGFDVCISGEAEFTLRRIAAWLDDEPGSEIPTPPGTSVKWGGTVLSGGERAFLDDLDQVPYPLLSYDCYDLNDYDSELHLLPGGLMTSRGCPARCTFCANYVTGRVFRWRTADNVLREMEVLRASHGVRHFAFFDDAFTANRPRLKELCQAMLRSDVIADCTWSCITPANMVSERDLELMFESGCRAINFGIESGDPLVLKSIKKGQNPDRVKRAVVAAKAVGMRTVVNFMFGFPGESEDQLKRTLSVMEDLAPHTDFFNQYGVLVPYPGTPVYQQYHETYGFRDWWLDPERIPKHDPLSNPTMEHDPALDIDFFHYPDAVKRMIAECVRFKAIHNRHRIELSSRKWVPQPSTISSG